MHKPLCFCKDKFCLWTCRNHPYTPWYSRDPALILDLVWSLFFSLSLSLSVLKEQYDPSAGENNFGPPTHNASGDNRHTEEAAGRPLANGLQRLFRIWGLWKRKLVTEIQFRYITGQRASKASYRGLFLGRQNHGAVGKTSRACVALQLFCRQ